MARRILGWVGLALVTLAVVGFGYERLARLGDASAYPPPGRLVGLGDHALHLVCEGDGSPTVVLEAGLGESALGWKSVQDELAATMRVCAYDRAGLAWSEPTTDPPTVERGAAELRELLEVAGEPGPYLLVAHSIGAWTARVFVSENSDEVAGLVLIDPTDEDAAIAVGDPTLPILERRLQVILSELGLVRLFGRGWVIDAVGAVPPEEVLAAVPILYGSKSQAATVRELETSVANARRVQETVHSGARADIPVVVISAANASAGEQARHAALAALSSRGEHVVAESGGHYVHYTEPALVVEAILRIAEGSH